MSLLVSQIYLKFLKEWYSTYMLFHCKENKDIFKKYKDTIVCGDVYFGVQQSFEPQQQNWNNFQSSEHNF